MCAPPLPCPLSHAYLITGGCAQSRREFARLVTAAYLCTGAHPPCGVCLACEKVQKGIHPDVLTLSPREGKKEIAADDTRALRMDVYIMPNEGARKVFLVDPADALNPTSQNILLKVLEDGPGYAAFLLLVDQPGRLLETVRSRCETIALPPEGELGDPVSVRLGEELAALLLEGSEWELAQFLVEVEGQKLGVAQALEVLGAAEGPVCRELGRSRRAARALGALARCRERAVLNPGPGHLFGWLCTEMFR